MNPVPAPKLAGFEVSTPGRISGVHRGRQLASDWRTPIHLGQGESAQRNAEHVVEHLIARNWNGPGEVSPSARALVTAAVLHACETECFPSPAISDSVRSGPGFL